MRRSRKHSTPLSTQTKTSQRGLITILSFSDAYQISNNVFYGNSYDICSRCKEKTGLSEYKAEKKLAGKLLGKRVFRLNSKVYICEDCLKEAYEEMFGEEEALDAALEAIAHD